MRNMAGYGWLTGCRGRISTDYVNDGKFTITEENLETKKFNGTLKSELADNTTYDWYALYPKNDKGSFTYIGHSKGATQKGNNSTAHLCGSLCPLYGIAKDINSSDPVAFEMQHLAAVVEIDVTNTTDEDLIVSTVTLASSDENIVGSYTIDFKGENVTYTDSDAQYVSKTATLNVVNGEAIPKDGNAKFYIPIKPHVAESGTMYRTMPARRSVPGSTAASPPGNPSRHQSCTTHRTPPSCRQTSCPAAPSGCM